MSAHWPVAGMLAARQIVRALNPNLLLWTRERWHQWLRTQRTALPRLEQRRLIVVARLTCFDDLFLHVGLMQVLALPAIRHSLVLTLPSEDMARIVRAQARRDEWDGLVQIFSEAECSETLDRLDGRTPVVVFDFPTSLSRPSLIRIAAVRASLKCEPDEAIIGDGRVYLGEAAASNSRAAKRDSSSEWLETASRLAEFNPKAVLALPQYPSEGEEISGMRDLSAGTLDRGRGRVRLGSWAPGDELIVTHVRNGFEPQVIVRRHADLSEQTGSFAIRLPGTFMTVSPQEVRVECCRADGQSTRSEVGIHVPPAKLEPWMISAYLNKGGGGNPVVSAFARGVGCRIAYAEDEPYRLKDVPVVWGVLRGSDRIIARAKEQGLYYFYIDHAYFNRGHGNAYRMTRNGYDAGPARDCPADRVRALAVETQPWRKGGREIVVCPPTDYFMQAHGCRDWLETTLSALASLTDRPIIVREKPKPGEAAVPLPEALKTAHALVTHSSNVAIEAACLGTPVFVAPTSAAAPIGRTDLSHIESPVYPDRDPWLAHLAYNQFSFEEFRDGTAWRMVRELEERDFV